MICERHTESYSARPKTNHRSSSEELYRFTVGFGQFFAKFAASLLFRLDAIEAHRRQEQIPRFARDDGKSVRAAG